MVLKIGARDGGIECSLQHSTNVLNPLACFV